MGLTFFKPQKTYYYGKIEQWPRRWPQRKPRRPFLLQNAGRRRHRCAGKRRAFQRKDQKDPKMHATRRNIAEFGGCSTAGKWIRNVLHAQKPMADYNFSGPLGALLRVVQQLDTQGDKGKRTVRLSANPLVIKGFPLTEKTRFDSVVRSPVDYTISRETGSVRVQIPPLMPAINLFTPDNYAMFRLVIAWGVVPDLYPDGRKDQTYNISTETRIEDAFLNEIRYYPSSQDYDDIPTEVFRSEWYPIVKGAPAIDKELTLEVFPAGY